MQPLIRDLAIQVGVAAVAVPKAMEYLGRYGITALSGNQLLLAAAAPVAVAGLVSKYFHSQKFEPMVAAAAGGLIAYLAKLDPKAALLATAISYVFYRLFSYLEKPQAKKLNDQFEKEVPLPKIAARENGARSAVDAQTLSNALQRLEESVKELPQEYQNVWSELFFCIQTLQNDLQDEVARRKELAEKLATLEAAQQSVLEAFRDGNGQSLLDRMNALEASHIAAAQAFFDFRTEITELNRYSSGSSSATSS